MHFYLPSRIGRDTKVATVCIRFNPTVVKDSEIKRELVTRFIAAT
ncbi:hypothetical protein PCAR4_530021 [Paraburkholderia caribensis]|nr:hypothetical protein PCAR4_530021 [Paraburkholderia caribensis]